MADYLEARHAAGASPATIRLARAAVAKVHQVSGTADPTADGLVTDVLKRIGRDGRDRGRGQVAGIGWSAAEAAASIASNGGDTLAGLRDGALLRVMSDGLLRISEASALRVSEVEATADGGAVTIRASKTDQHGRRRGAVPRHADRGGRAAATSKPPSITGGPLFRRIRKGGQVTDDRAGRRLDPGDRPPARGGRRRDHRPDRRPLAAGRLGARARRRWRVPGRAPAGGRMALAHHAGGLCPAGVRHARAGRSAALRGGAVGGAASARRGHRVSVPMRAAPALALQLTGPIRPAGRVTHGSADAATSGALYRVSAPRRATNRMIWLRTHTVRAILTHDNRNARATMHRVKWLGALSRSTRKPVSAASVASPSVTIVQESTLEMVTKCPLLRTMSSLGRRRESEDDRGSRDRKSEKRPEERCEGSVQRTVVIRQNAVGDLGAAKGVEPAAETCRRHDGHDKLRTEKMLPPPFRQNVHPDATPAASATSASTSAYASSIAW